MNNMNGDELRQLRLRAEAVLASEGEKNILNTEDTRTLIHDLQVHQIELEMQNDELRTSRNELELARDDYVRLYNQAPVGYISINENGIVKRANQTFLDMLGCDDRDVKGQPFSLFIIDGDRDVFLGRFGAVFRHPEGKTLDVRLKTRQGHLVARLTARREEQGKKLLVIVTDITERKIADDKIQALLDEKKLLLQEVHHRIKNNMNVSISLLSLQEDQIENPEAKATLAAARGRMLSMMVIYDKLYRSGDYRNISAESYFTQLLEALTAQFDTSRIRFEHTFDDIILDSSVLSPLGIILNELLTNAYKYAFPSGGKGTVTVRLSGLDDGTATLAVSDDGAGLGEAFDIHEQKGFGLVLVTGLAAQIGGSVSLDKENGTSFTVRFPLRSN